MSNDRLGCSAGRRIKTLSIGSNTLSGLRICLSCFGCDNSISGGSAGILYAIIGICSIGGHGFRIRTCGSIVHRGLIFFGFDYHGASGKYHCTGHHTEDTFSYTFGDVL